MSSSLARLFAPRRVATALGVLIVVAIAVFVFQAVRAAKALTAARTDAAALAQDLADGNLAKATVDAASLRGHASSARSAVGGPLWWLGAQVPYFGANVSAVHDTAVALDVIAKRAMPTLLHVADEVQHGTLRPRDGRISPTAVAALAPDLHAAAVALSGPAAEIARINISNLIGPLQSPLRQVQQRVHDAQTAVDAAANAFTVLPTMLGGHGPRTYLLLVQNPAEIRAAGGLPGTWVILRADQGRISLVSASPAGPYTPKKPPITPTAEEGELFGTDWGLTASDATQSPDFRRDAQMAAAIAAQHGARVSAVFSVDPIALSLVLKGTGPVKIAGGVTLTASNAVPILLNQVYRTLSADRQNAFYAYAASQIFGALVHGEGDQLLAIRGLVDGVAQHRVFAWSNDPELAKVIDAESLTGAFPTNTGTTPQVGVYLNDAVAGKQEYYLRQDTAARATSCHAGVQSITLTAHFRSLMPADPSVLPEFITGTGEYAPRGHMFMTLYLAGPWRGTVDSVSVNGVAQTVTSNTLDGRQLALIALVIPPQQSVTVTAVMHSGPGQTGSGQLTWTPGMTPESDPVSFAGAC